uniref:Uncharacterized protein n=1 Tax=Ditylenchus dipsaci TaxID=166011 RepID=A0A915CK43_9BILA
MSTVVNNHQIASSSGFLHQALLATASDTLKCVTAKTNSFFRIQNRRFYQGKDFLVVLRYLLGQDFLQVDLASASS